MLLAASNWKSKLWRLNKWESPSQRRSPSCWDQTRIGLWVGISMVLISHSFLVVTSWLQESCYRSDIMFPFKTERSKRGTVSNKKASAFPQPHSQIPLMFCYPCCIMWLHPGSRKARKADLSLLASVVKMVGGRDWGMGVCPAVIFRAPCVLLIVQPLWCTAGGLLGSTAGGTLFSFS